MLERHVGGVPTLPLYEYQCPKDGTFEKIQKFSDPPLEACPTCGGPIEKLLSAPAIQFKGTGWYITDYARKSGGGESARDKKERKEESAAAKASQDSSSSSSSTPTTTPSSGTTTDSKSTDKK
jgi:putative FmdB family regulatory protein